MRGMHILNPAKKPKSLAVAIVTAGVVAGSEEEDGAVSASALYGDATRLYGDPTRLYGAP
jgi:hypothetical protein